MEGIDKQTQGCSISNLNKSKTWHKKIQGLVHDTREYSNNVHACDETTIRHEDIEVFMSTREDLLQFTGCELEMSLCAFYQLVRDLTLTVLLKYHQTGSKSHYNFQLQERHTSLPKYNTRPLHLC